MSKINLTPEQEAAGNAAMTGEFTMRNVIDALEGAGVKDTRGRSAKAADQLMIAARDAGKVEFVMGKLWRVVK